MSIKLYIDRGKEADAENIYIFNQLLTHKETIEEKLNFEINWLKLDEYRACIIESEIGLGGWQTNPDDWNIVIDESIRRMIIIRDTIQPFINAIKV